MQKTLETHHPDEERKPRLPDSIAQPIAIMPLSRIENTTFAMPAIIDSHDMGLRTVFSPDAQKKTPISPIFSLYLAVSSVSIFYLKSKFSLVSVLKDS
ncbi:hypothetical protein TNCV_3181291 [Trichonephila clavipes]|nr:hypothetical protein TNCV_3181291 [Trichonephila clavipes]